MNLYKKCISKTYLFQVINTTLASEKYNVLLKIQYDINREVAKRSALSSDKIDKNKYLISEETLLSDKSRITQQTKFTYSPACKAFGKLNKNN